ncbi:MAG TPA: SIMPL domain-containing protein [Candidatus Cybelea sp.]
MKRTFFCLLTAFLASTGCAFAVQSGVTNITATGTGTVSLPPDMATVSAAVETTAARAEDAVSQNNQIYDRVVASLGRLGIARNDITLAYYNVNYNPPPQVTTSNPGGERYGYTVSRSFNVKVRSIGKAGAVSDASVAAGATSINGVSFGLADPSVARAQAIAKAEADARNAAGALARTANLRIVSIKNIELQNGFVGGPVPLGAMARTSAPTVLDQSNVTVTATVTVVYTAQP